MKTAAKVQTYIDELYKLSFTNEQKCYTNQSLTKMSDLSTTYNAQAKGD